MFLAKITAPSKLSPNINGIKYGAKNKLIAAKIICIENDILTKIDNIII